jgi:hypothetical protein
MSEISHLKVTLGVREKVIEKCWDYLYRHFENFSDANRLKVILAICPKNIPQKVEGMNTQQTVIMGEIKRSDGSVLRYNLGSRDSSEVIATSPEAVSSN